MFKIVRQKAEDAPQIEALLDLVFGPNRQAKASYVYRRSVAPVAELCLVARDGRAIVGTLRFWPVGVGPALSPALLLGPIGVAPERQKTGIGRALIARGHTLAQTLGHRVVVLVGEADYYCRFGYLAAGAHGIVMPGEAPQRTLVHELVSGSLRGVRGDILPQPAGKIAAGPLA